MDHAEVELCRQAFKIFDKHDTGTIPKTELTSLLRSMGTNPTDSEVNDMINEVDVDGSGVVEFEEFVNFVARLMKNADHENEIREAYRRFDCDNEGGISVDEFRHIMSNLPVKVSPADIEEMLKEVNLESQEKISYLEFKKMMGH